MREQYYEDLLEALTWYINEFDYLHKLVPDNDENLKRLIRIEKIKEETIAERDKYRIPFVASKTPNIAGINNPPINF